MDRRFFLLSEITRRIGELLQPAIVKRFWVKAEISSGRERGGSFFCDLIETGTNGKIAAKISCNIWQQELTSIRTLFKSRNMDLVLTDGTIVGFQCSLQYSPQYGISLRVIDADPSIALGEMELKKREIIERLQKEGLFEPNKALPVQLLPIKLGLITSAGSAAYNDFIQTLTSSGFGFQIHLADAMMQGDQTEKSVLRALAALCKLEVELILIIRGGGSKTDLYFLDNETIARSIANCGTPVWTGIGHEIDTSIMDLVANRSFKTPTAVAEELVARFVLMRRRLDESANTLNTVWSYRLKADQNYLARAVTGIQQGPRKLLEVTASHLHGQAQELRLRVQERMSTEKLSIGRRKEKLRSLPLSQIHTFSERLTSKRLILESRVRFQVSRAETTLSGMKQRFEKDRFLRRLHAERENNTKSRHQLKNVFLRALKVNAVQLVGLKDRLKEERVLYRIVIARKSLHEMMATLKAVDPQTILQRGFALVYSQDGKLIRSVVNITAKDRINTQLADGKVISEVLSKEINRE